MRSEIQVLGYVRSENKIKIDPREIDAIEKFPAPESVKMLRSFLGLVHYCREFVPSLPTITSPLYDLLKGKLARFFLKQRGLMCGDSHNPIYSN